MIRWRAPDSNTGFGGCGKQGRWAPSSPAHPKTPSLLQVPTPITQMEISVKRVSPTPSPCSLS